MSVKINKIIGKQYRVTKIIELDKICSAIDICENEKEKIIFVYKKHNSKYIRFYMKYCELNHPNLEKIKLVKNFEDNFLVVKDIYIKNELVIKFKQYREWSTNYEEQIVYYLYSLISALKVLHDNDIIHRGIHLSNAVIKDNSFILLLDPKSANEKLNIAYSFNSPESSNGQIITKKYDIWCLGWCIYSLVTFTNPSNLLKNVGDFSLWSKKSSILNQCSLLLNDIFNKMTEIDAMKRPSCEELLTHEIFEKIEHSIRKCKLNERYSIMNDAKGMAFNNFKVYDEFEKETKVVKRFLISDRTTFHTIKTIEKIKCLNLNTIVDFFNEDIFCYAIQQNYEQKNQFSKKAFLNNQVDDEEIRLWFYQLIKALDSLHSNSVIHKKISFDSVLFDENRTIKLDINLESSIVKPDENLINVNRIDVDYNSPELIYSNKSETLNINFKYDIWCMGWTLIGICNLKEYREYLKNCNFNDFYLELPEFLDEDLSIILRRMVTSDPRLRPSTQEILNHQTFSDFGLIESKGFLITNVFEFKNFYKNVHNYTICKENKRKNLKIINCFDSINRSDLFKELNELTQIDNINVLKYYEIFSDLNDKIYIIEDYFTNSTLSELIYSCKQNSEVFNEDEIIEWMAQITNGISYLHKLSDKIVYLYLNPQNIVLLPNNQIKLVNILSETLQKEKFDNNEINEDDIYYIRYMSPEVIERSYHKNSDLWATGCILYELVHLKNAYGQAALNELYDSILNLQVPNLDCSNVKLEEVFNKLMSKNPEIRCSSSQAHNDFEGLLKLNQVIQKYSILKSHQQAIDKTKTQLFSKKTFNDKYICVKYIDEGSFGKVFLVKEIETNEKYALKELRNNIRSNSSNEISISGESKILKFFDHVNVIGFNECFQNFDGKICLVFEYCDAGDLKKVLLRLKQGNSKKLSTNEIKKWFYELMSGLEHIHSRIILHKDIKPANLLLKKVPNELPILKIGDFGLSKILNQPNVQLTGRGTEIYKSPEIYMREGMSEKSDVWSAGCVLFEMVHLKFLFKSIEDENGKPIFENVPKLNFDREIDKIYDKMMKKCPNERASSLEILENLNQIKSREVLLEETE